MKHFSTILLVIGFFSVNLALGKVGLSGILFPQSSMKEEDDTGFMSIEKMFEQWNELVGMFTKSEKYREKVRENHEKYGAFRSGEGTPDEVRERIKEIEERQYLKKLYES
jgi:hypothetical protein